MRPFRIVPVAAAATLALAACSDGGTASEAAPQERLERAADLLDETSSVRFTVESENLPESGTAVIGAEGVAVPPDSFEGDIRVRDGDLSATVEVVSVDGELWAKLPLTTEFAEVDAESLGFPDPGGLLDPQRGVGRLLRSGGNLAAADDVRLDGEVLSQVTAVLPGEVVGEVLTIADGDAEVAATFALEPDTGRLRRAVLTGPFLPGGDQTYTVLLDDYDRDVQISAPAD